MISEYLTGMSLKLTENIKRAIKFKKMLQIVPQFTNVSSAIQISKTGDNSFSENVCLRIQNQSTTRRTDNQILIYNILERFSKNGLRKTKKNRN